MSACDPSVFASACVAAMEAGQRFNLDRSPAANATLIVREVCHSIGEIDPYESVKKAQNEMALKLETTAKELIEESQDRIATALLVSCIGNVIDLGAQDSFDLEEEFTAMTRDGFARSDMAEFEDQLREARRLLFLADNSGEIVFDKVLLETLPTDLTKAVAVKSGPIINDATIDDALSVGLDRTARIITTGSSDLGVNLENISNELTQELRCADIIVAKGHANFETLNEEKKGIFFLLKAKCDVVARELGVKKGSLVFARY